MKCGLCLALSALASCAALPTSSQQPPVSTAHDSRFTIYLGQRNLDEDDYDPVDEQGTLGFEFARETPGSAIGWEVGLMGSGDDEDVGGFDVEGRTGEIYGGVRKTFGMDTIRPHVGGGLAAINSEVEVGGSSDDDTSLAGYVHGGITFQVATSFFLGLDLRLLFGSDMEIAGVETDADYGQLAVLLGFAF